MRSIVPSPENPERRESTRSENSRSRGCTLGGDGIPSRHYETRGFRIDAWLGPRRFSSTNLLGVVVALGAVECLCRIIRRRGGCVGGAGDSALAGPVVCMDDDGGGRVGIARRVAGPATNALDANPAKRPGLPGLSRRFAGSGGRGRIGRMAHRATGADGIPSPVGPTSRSGAFVGGRLVPGGVLSPAVPLSLLGLSDAGENGPSAAISRPRPQADHAGGAARH